jgi:UDP-glucose 4-epimerase
MDRALVTGGCGFIGSHLVDELSRSGVRVEVVDDLSATENESFYYNSSATYHKCDILNKTKLERIFKDFSPNVVFHLAAKARIQRAIENPQNTCDVNFNGTCNVLEFSRLTGADRVIFSSTSSVYGLKNPCPQDENMPKDCLNPYSVSKSAAEELCNMYYDLYDLKTIIFRYFNVFGERQPVKGDYAPVVGLFYRQKELGGPMTIVGDGLQTRDFTYVQDVVQANILAAKTDDGKAFGQVFNVGSGTNTSVLEISEMIGGSTMCLPPRVGEARETLANISKICEILKFSPTKALREWIEEENNKEE